MFSFSRNELRPIGAEQREAPPIPARQVLREDHPMVLREKCTEGVADGMAPHLTPAPKACGPGALP